jgi:hypothetical protein
MKKESIGDPDIYLGSKLRKMVLLNGVEAWMMSPAKYVREAVRNVERFLDKEYGTKLPKRVSGPLPTNYRPETDVTPELEGEELSYYHSQIGVLRWIVELGRIDIITEVSSLASCLALPRKGHLEAVFHLYTYLKKKPNGTIILDPSYPLIDQDDVDHNAIDQYLHAEVKLPIAGEMKTGRVIKRKRDVNGDLVGKSSSNPYMDIRRYIVSFEDDMESEYAANVIAENMLSRCDHERNQHALLRHIIDHKSDSTAVPREEGFAWSRGRKSPRRTTKGWKLCVEWKDGSTSWEPLSALKESIPVKWRNMPLPTG